MGSRNVYENRTTKIPTARLNEEMLPLIEAYPPPSNKGKYIKIKYITQLPNTQVPSFVYFANLPQYVKEPYKRFLENKMREKWNLTGTPINIFHVQSDSQTVLPVCLGTKSCLRTTGRHGR